MANEGFVITIPTTMDPFVVDVNGKIYSFPAGTEQVVNQEVYEVIQNIQAQEPKPVAPSGGGGGDMLVTITAVMAMDAEAEPQYVADKTFEEIESAVNAGKNVRVKFFLEGVDAYIPMIMHSPGNEIGFMSIAIGVRIYIDPDGVFVQIMN